MIFGATGDLAARKLIPALYALHLGEGLHPETHVVAFARSDWSDEKLRGAMTDAVKRYRPDAFDAERWRQLAQRMSYVRGDYDAAGGYSTLAEKLHELGIHQRIYYTATPPAAYEPIVRGLTGAGLAGKDDPGARLVVEKPFGRDLASARELNEVVLNAFEEEQVYRIDHYLAKETTQNLAVLRFANSLFEPIWSGRYVDHVQITMAEDIGVAGRGGFYEDAGVIRDVFQNHLLQLVALIATEPPARFEARSVRDEKVKVFRAMSCPSAPDSVLGQYAGSGDTQAYRDEDGVPFDSRQATFAAVEFCIENWRWAGVPFFVRSGKRLSAKASEIVLELKQPPHVPFKLPRPLLADRLVLRLVPDEGITFRFNAKAPGQGIDIDRVSLDFYYRDQFARPSPDAYETLLMDLMRGDPTLFMRADEVEEQWRIVEPILTAWEGGRLEPYPYPAGSWGPDAADKLLARRGRRWYAPGNAKEDGV